MKKVKFTPKKFLQNLGWVLALCAWAFLSLELSAVAVSLVLRLFVSTESLSTPVWTTVYNAISYSLAVLLTVFVPYLILRQRHKNHHKNRQKTNSKQKAQSTKTPAQPQNPATLNPSHLASAPTRNQLGLRELPTWIDLLLAPVGFIAYLIASSLLIALFSNFSWFDASETQDVGYSTFLAGSELIIAFVALVVIAPIAEEIIFRGWLYGKLRTRLNIPLAAIIVSILFALLHGQWNVAVNVFALSLILCALREITGTIYAGIILHMLKNGVAFYLLYVIHVST